MLAVWIKRHFSGGRGFCPWLCCVAGLSLWCHMSKGYRFCCVCLVSSSCVACCSGNFMAFVVIFFFWFFFLKNCTDTACNSVCGNSSLHLQSGFTYDLYSPVSRIWSKLPEMIWLGHSSTRELTAFVSTVLLCEVLLSLAGRYATVLHFVYRITTSNAARLSTVCSVVALHDHSLRALVVTNSIRRDGCVALSHDYCIRPARLRPST